MSTEAIRKKFELVCKKPDRVHFNNDTKSYDPNTHKQRNMAAIYNSAWIGYQQAVKDMEDSYKHDLTLIINQLRCGISKTSNSSTILQGALSDLIILRGNHE